MAIPETARHRIDGRVLTALVAAVDLSLIGVFVLAGEISHSVDPVANPWLVADTYVPFALGWIVVALPAGLYAERAWRSPRGAATWTVPAWIGATALAQGLRATRLFHGDADPVFFLVSTAVGVALLGPWRVAVAWLGRERP